MKPWKILIAIMQAVVGFGFFQGAFFDGWLAVVGGLVLSVGAVLTLTEALRPARGSLITPRGK